MLIPTTVYQLGFRIALCTSKSCYEAYVKCKFRYKIYLAMNDVTSMLYVSLVMQSETLLFYVVTSRIERHLLYRVTSF